MRGVSKVILGFFLAAALLSAQVETARITGTISDSTGAVIPGAQITFVHVSTNTSIEMQSDATGRYVSPPLRIGQYRIEVSSEGFKRTVRTGVTLEVQETALLNFALEVGAITESIDVTADAPLLTTTEATQGQVIGNDRIVDMPLNGRNYTQLALLSAGTVVPVGGRFGGFSSGGQRTTHNNFLLDGVDNNNVQLAAQGRRGEAVRPSVDAIQEFKVSTNAYSAEYGRAMGGVVNATIKSGSNEFHGTVFHFIRNEALDAKNFFDSPTADKPPFKRNQFGGSAGGPIIKNKLFVFGDYEGTRIRESATVNNTIPTLAAREGDFSAYNPIFDPATYDAATKTRQPFPNNIIPSTRFDAVAAQAKDWYPTPQNSSLTQNFLFNPPSMENVHKWDVRTDYVASSTDTVYFRFSSHRNFIPGTPNLPEPAFGGGGSTPFTHTGNNMALVWNHVFTPSIVTSTRAAWNRLYTDREPPIDYNVNSQIGLKGVEQDLAGAPQFGISGVTNLGIGANIPNLVDSQARQLVSDTTWTRGKHSLKFGINFTWLQSYLSNPKQALGNFNFNGNFTRNPDGNVGGEPFADFLLGISRQTDVAKPVYANLRAPYYQFYVQDEWRVTTRLTLNLGVRYDRNNPWVEKDDGLSNFDIGLAEPTLILAQPGSRASRSTMEADTNNIAPRFGFAYRATQKMVVRGGYGIFYGNYEGTGGGRFLLGNPPNTISVRISTNNIDPAFLLEDGVPAGTLEPENVANLRQTYFERNPNWPMAQQWNLNIQTEVAKDLLWEVGYYGTKSQFLPTRWEGNYKLPGPGNVNRGRRFSSVTYPGTSIVISPLSRVDAHNYVGNSLYHSLQTKIEKRFSNGFSLLTSYTFSRTIGDLSGFSGSGSAANSGIQNMRDFRAERSLDNQHRKHRFVASYLYDLPFGVGRPWGNNWNRVTDLILGGWTISGITTFTSGEPMGVDVRGDPANTGDLNRPNVVASEGDPNLSKDERSLQRFFNIDAFVPNDPYTYGNAGRNILIGPDTVNFDLAVFKRFKITEDFAAQFRAEAFNAFNTPNFGNPNLEVGNRNIGIISGAGRPRNLQFALKLIW